MSLVGYRRGPFKSGESVNEDMLHELAASLDSEVDSPKKEGGSSRKSAQDADPEPDRCTVRAEASDKKVVPASGSESPHWMHVLATALLRLIEHVALLAAIAVALATVYQKGEQVITELAKDPPSVIRVMYYLGVNTPKAVNDVLLFMLTFTALVGWFCAAVLFFFGVRPLVKPGWQQILLYFVLMLSILYLGITVMLFVVVFSG